MRRNLYKLKVCLFSLRVTDKKRIFVRHKSKKKDQKADLTGSATGTIDTNVVTIEKINKFFNNKF